MSFKITEAYIRGSWDGVPGESNFTQDDKVVTSRLSIDFYSDYADEDIYDIIDEYRPYVLDRMRYITPDGKVMINTIVFVDKDVHDQYMADPRWESEKKATKKYKVVKAEREEDINTFDEENGIYYHSSEHLI